MKSLVLLLLTLVLAGGLLFMTMGGSRSVRDPDRRARDLPAQGGGDGVQPAPEHATPEPQSPIRAARAPERDEVHRESIAAAPGPALRINYEGAVIAEGAPLPGADLVLLVGDQPLADARTNERGAFRLSVPAHPEAMRLDVRARGFVGLERSLPARPAGGTEILGNLRLLRGTMLTGRVIDQGGRGIGGAEVRVEPMSAGRDVLTSRAVTKADGSFEIPDSPPGGVVVRARATGYGERLVNHVVKEGSTVLVEMAPGLDLLVQLVTPRGDPVVGADLSLMGATNSRVPARREASDERGRVAFRELGPELWNLRVAHPDYRPTGKNQIRAGEPELVLQCNPWPALEGRVVTPDGSPLPAETRVQAMPSAAPGDQMGSLPAGQPLGPEGQFRIGGLRSGSWTVRVTAPGYAPTQSASVQLGIEGDGWAGTITLDGGGELLLSLLRGDEPVSRADVEVSAREPSLAQLWALRDSEGVLGQRITVTGGQARFASLPAGPVWAMVFAEGSPPMVAGPFQVTSGRVIEQEIDLPPGARAHGKTSSADGTPCLEAQVRVIDREGRLGFPLTMAPGASGEYLTPWLPPGRYTIEAFSTSHPTRRSGANELVLEAGKVLELDLTL
jgi:hypothetical protein